MNTHCKLSGIYISNQMRSGREKPLCRGIRRSQGHGGGFHIISVKCFYLTAVTVSDKLMSAPVFELYYEIIFQTRSLKLDQSYIVGWLKVAGLASITRRDSEGQCKEQCLALALSVLSHVWQAGQRRTGLQAGSEVQQSVFRSENLSGCWVITDVITQEFCLRGCKIVSLINLMTTNLDFIYFFFFKRPFLLLVWLETDTFKICLRL